MPRTINPFLRGVLNGRGLWGVSFFYAKNPQINPPPSHPDFFATFLRFHLHLHLCICVSPDPRARPGAAQRGPPPAVLGMALTALLSPVAVAGSLAVAAGSFLYIGASDVVVEEFVQGVAGGPRTAHTQRAHNPCRQCSRRPSCEKIIQRTGQ